ncbi:MAG: hypothetical protein WBG86_19845 [Polyangiales bacterium]
MIQRCLVLPVLILALCAGCTDGGGERRSGTGGTAGSDGTGGTSGTGGTTPIPQCQVGNLCAACPADEDRCEQASDCAPGHTCIQSGCATLEGNPIQICVLASGSFCRDDDDCPGERVCTDLGIEGLRCVKTTPGCDSDFDCVLGFLCEEEECVDRRVPCVHDDDCPMSHVCEGIDVSRFCHRVHQVCEGELDCAGIAPRCVDIDGDGTTECAGSSEPNAPSPVACVNADCADPFAPVCEVSEAGSTSVCGQYGLCLDGDDCTDGFECVGLWTDGHKECVPEGGTCSRIVDCPERQVCASPRSGGPPACQAGVE